MKYKFIVLDKENNVTIKSTKSLDTLYKTCGYRKDIDFINLNTWNNVMIDNKKISVTLWGKSNGKINNINNSHIIKQLMNKNIYGIVVFVFKENENIFENIDMNIWETFKDQVIKLQPNIHSDSEYTFDNEDNYDEYDSMSNDDIGEDFSSKKETVNNELTYEPYYISSDDENEI